MLSVKRGIQYCGIVALTLFYQGVVAKDLFLKTGSLSRAQLSQYSIQNLKNQNEDINLTQGYWILQFKTSVTESLKKELRLRGYRILRYLPEDALLVWVPRAERQLISENEKIIKALVYSPLMKMSPDLEKPSLENMFRKLDVVILKTKSIRSEYFHNQLKTIGSLNKIEENAEIVRAQVHSTDLQALSKLNSVEWVEPYKALKTAEFNPQLDSYDSSAFSDSSRSLAVTGYENGTKIMNFQAAWDRGYTGQNQIVSMADTGLDSGDLNTIHKDFVGQILDGEIYGQFSKSWSDPNGHGTHVAGSILSKGEAAPGGFKGGAFGAKLVVQGMWSMGLGDFIPAGLTVPVEVSQLFRGAYEKGARIHTNSWGNPSLFNLGNYDKNSMQVDKFMWENPDMLIIFAAGNEGIDKNFDGHIDPGSVMSPGTAKNALTVGASENLMSEGGIQVQHKKIAGGKVWPAEPIASDTPSNNPNGMAAFSSIGPTRDGRIKPDVVAPGTNIVSNCSQAKGASPLWGRYNSDYCFCGGTSMSTPLVAGAAAVVRQYLAQEFSLENPKAATVKAILMNSATDMFPGQYGLGEGQEFGRAPNFNQGYGRVNMDKATQKSSQFFARVIEHDGLATDEIYTLELNPSDLSLDCKGNSQSQETLSFGSCLAKKIKVTLVYNDAPAAPLSSRTLVNNLDLSVNIDSRELVSASEVNNSEQVFVEELSADTQKVIIKVIGKNIPEGKNGILPFSLIVSKDL